MSLLRLSDLRLTEDEERALHAKWLDALHISSSKRKLFTLSEQSAQYFKELLLKYGKPSWVQGWDIDEALKRPKHRYQRRKLTRR